MTTRGNKENWRENGQSVETPMDGSDGASGNGGTGIGRRGWETGAEP